MPNVQNNQISINNVSLNVQTYGFLVGIDEKYDIYNAKVELNKKYEFKFEINTNKAQQGKNKNQELNNETKDSKDSSGDIGLQSNNPSTNNLYITEIIEYNNSI